jgi:hypothetical protein
MAESLTEHRTKTTKERRHLRVALTNEELLAAGQKLADQLRQKQSLEAEAGAISKQYKAKIAEVDAALEVTRGLVHDRYEIRPVECVNVLDYTDVRCRVTRTDTREIIEDRKLTEDEKQTSLPFDEEAAQDNTGGDIAAA